MLSRPIRTQVKLLNNGVLGNFVSGLGSQIRYKSQTPCKDVSQTEGKTIENWPKQETPPDCWRCTCPQDPQPPNYDPYKIKVPNVVVPPLPPSNAKGLSNAEWEKLLQDVEAEGPPKISMQQVYHVGPVIHPDYFNEGAKLPRQVEELLPNLGNHGNKKYRYAFYQPWNPLDRLSLIAQAEKEAETEKPT